jgi:hypothetical protein
VKVVVRRAGLERDAAKTELLARSEDGEMVRKEAGASRMSADRAREEAAVARLELANDGGCSFRQQEGTTESVSFLQIPR